MLLVIFGAGASHGSATVDGVNPPPLAEQLLDYPEIAARYPGSATVVDYLQRVMAEHALSLEDALAKFGEVAERSTVRQQQLVAFRFYLCDVINTVSTDWLGATHGQTRYLTLLNYLWEWQEKSGEPIRLATFNYDRLIENALGNLVPDWSLRNLMSYIERPAWSLLKLHGSVTWSRVIESDEALGDTNFNRAIMAANRFARGDLGLKLQTAPAQATETTSVAIPALAVPMTGKTNFECPPEHIEALTTSIPHVKRVLICGWRAAEDHMVQALEGLLPGFHLGVVAHGDTDVQEVHERLGAVDRKGHPMLDQPGGMEALVANLAQNLGGLLAPWV